MSAEPPGGDRHINIHVSPELMAGVYANFANVSHSDYEFTITFARVDHEVESAEIPGIIVSRVSLSPRFMRELIAALEDNYSRWEAREGIKSLPEFEAPPGDLETTRSRPLAGRVGGAMPIRSTIGGGCRAVAESQPGRIGIGEVLAGDPLLERRRTRPGRR